MSIFEAFGGVPSNLTVPLTVATVAGSIGVAAVAAIGWSAMGLDAAGVSSFLLQAASASNAHSASVLTAIILLLVLLFMMSTFHFIL
jgi:hypothetical protein